jgi:hypothetical protein
MSPHFSSQMRFTIHNSFRVVTNAGAHQPAAEWEPEWMVVPTFSLASRFDCVAALALIGAVIVSLSFWVAASVSF